MKAAAKLQPSNCCDGRFVTGEGYGDQVLRGTEERVLFLVRGRSQLIAEEGRALLKCHYDKTRGGHA